MSEVLDVYLEYFDISFLKRVIFHGVRKGKVLRGMFP